MNYSLEEFSTMLRKLQNSGVNQYDKEIIMQMLSQTNQIVDILDDEGRRMNAMISMMDSSRTFGMCMEAMTSALNKKRQEIEAWEDIRMMMRRLMN